MKKFIKTNIKIVLGFILGLIWSSGIAYAATILFDSDEVSYDNTTSGLSATNVQSALDELYVESTSYQLFESRVSTLESQVYPVGSIYISTNSINPATLFGGRWERIEGKFLLGATDNGASSWSLTTKSANIAAGVSGGESDHQLTVSELAKHHHPFYGASYGQSIPSGFNSAITEDGKKVYGYNNGGVTFWPVGNTGEDKSHNNMPPFLSVYIWKRTA